MLASLHPGDAILLRRSLRRTAHRVGEQIALGETDLVYFPETLVACLLGQDRKSAIGIIGRDGLIGWGRLFSTEDRADQAFVSLCDGSALAMTGTRLRTLVLTRPTLAASLVPYLQAFAEQMGHTIVCGLHRTLEARISGWLLMMHERLGDELVITHRALAEFLNVRRASVTDTLHVLEGERALRCGRGRIVVRDRDVLAKRAMTDAAARERAPGGKPEMRGRAIPCAL